MKLSIITINYNNVEGLRCTQKSIICQTFADYEWIVIDGGSTDGSKEFLYEHNAELAYWCSEKDNGVYNAQNKGILKAKGEYLIFMNSGDSFCDNGVLGRVFATEHDADILYGNWIQAFPDGRELQITAPSDISLHFFYIDNICHQAMFIKGSVMKDSPYDETYKIYADWAKWIELALNNKTFVYVPYNICYFMMDGISQTDIERCKEERAYLHKTAFPAIIRKSLQEIVDNREKIISQKEQIENIRQYSDGLEQSNRQLSQQLQECQQDIYTLKENISCNQQLIDAQARLLSHRSVRLSLKLEKTIDGINRTFNLGPYNKRKFETDSNLLE